MTRGGGMRLMVETNQRLRPGARVRLRLARPSTAIVALVNRAGARRVFERVTVRRARTVSVRLPGRIGLGRYRVTCS